MSSTPGPLFFTSDHHFGHRGILSHCARPFPDTDTMDAHLIDRWNAQIGDEAVVYHLGDFTLKSRGYARQILGALRGHIRILGLPWHHDSGWVPKQPGVTDILSASGHPVEILPPLLAMKLPLPDGEKVVVTLSHYPLAEWESSHHGAWHLHGHSHGTHHGPGRKLDVGVDCAPDYAPLALEEVAARMAPLSPPPLSPEAALPL